MQVVVLSPHRDDAAFSCGLLLGALLAAGAGVTIVNVCTVSDYAPYLRNDGGDRIRQVTAARAAEDAAFVTRLTQDANVEENRVELVDAAWQDAPLRWQIESERVLRQSTLRPAETYALSQQLRAFSAAGLVLAPLALGSHIDHLLVREAGRNVFGPESLLFYEDLPYACRMPANERALANCERNLASCEVWLPANLTVSGTKRRYASCYPSQIACPVAEEMDRYAGELGGTERFYGTPKAVRRAQAGVERHGITQ